MAAHGKRALPQGFHLISLLRRQLPLEGKPLAAHGQQALNLGDALPLPLGEVSPQVTERARLTASASIHPRCIKSPTMHKN